MKHWAIFITNKSNKAIFVKRLLAGKLSGLQLPNEAKGALFSKLALVRFIDKEERHGTRVLAKDKRQSLKSMSSGEQKKALLQHLFQADLDFIVLDSPFDNLDRDAQDELVKDLTQRSKHTTFIQIISRKNDLLPFITQFAKLEIDTLHILDSAESASAPEEQVYLSGAIPQPLQPITSPADTLIELKNVSVRFGEKRVLQRLHWKVRKGEFWQLIGKNGSGKTTILSMITGDNPKGYGQELYLFGEKKGTGESIWDIKKKIGYFTPAMTDSFTGYHSLEHMLISGLNDSIGLYIKPSEAQLRVAKQWLELTNLWPLKDTLYHDLSLGQKRLVMTIRAMIKHPPLLILDEPTAGLDDVSAQMLVELVNKIAKESDTATIFVSHRSEPGLQPDFVYELQMSENGSQGRVVTMP